MPNRPKFRRSQNHFNDVSQKTLFHPGQYVSNYRRVLKMLPIKPQLPYTFGNVQRFLNSMSRSIFDTDESVTSSSSTTTKTQSPLTRSAVTKFDIRRYFLIGNDGNLKGPSLRAQGYEDEKDDNLKTKISTLVQQTIHDTERKIKSIQYIKEKNREEPPYKAGFILSMIKKSRDVLNELFNVAVKHKDEWKALEQLKIFELIVHTNVDTTNLVRQLVEIHIQHLNATNPENQKGSLRRRVVLLK